MYSTTYCCIHWIFSFKNNFFSFNPTYYYHEPMCTTFLQNYFKIIGIVFMTVSAVFILQATNIDLYLLPLILDTIYIISWTSLPQRQTTPENYNGRPCLHQWEGNKQLKNRYKEIQTGWYSQVFQTPMKTWITGNLTITKGTTTLFKWLYLWSCSLNLHLSNISHYIHSITAIIMLNTHNSSPSDHCQRNVCYFHQCGVTMKCYQSFKLRI